MTARTVNWALYFVTFGLIATGVATLGTNRADAGWLYDAHRYTGALLCVLLIPKFGIILRAYARRLRLGTFNQLNVWGGFVLTLLLLVSLVGALAWTLNLAPFWVQIVLYITPLALHWYLALAIIPFFLWHVWVRWLPPLSFAKMPRQLLNSKLSRRQALSLFGVGALGVLGWGALEFTANMTAWQRRFTGSRLVAEFTGNAYPVTQSGAPPIIDIENWRLQVRGKDARPYALTYAELLALTVEERTATIDCTLGWAATQQWRGIRLGQLLARAGWDGHGPVTVYAANGEAAAFVPQDIGETLLATHIGQEQLSPDHGFPARLVVPSRRGYQWLKWVTEIVIS